MPKTTDECRLKLREQFLKNKNITDIRITDMLLIKGQMELNETVKIWKQPNQLLKYWIENDQQQPEPTEFLTKFLNGRN